MQIPCSVLHTVSYASRFTLVTTQVFTSQHIPLDKHHAPTTSSSILAFPAPTTGPTPTFHSEWAIRQWAVGGWQG